MQVSVIVMMTKLVENTKRKAHQYWPESSGDEPSRQKLEIGGGCSVEHLSTSFQGTYFHRQATSFEKENLGKIATFSRRQEPMLPDRQYHTIFPDGRQSLQFFIMPHCQEVFVAFAQRQTKGDCSAAHQRLARSERT